MTTISWPQWLRRLLCKLFRAWEESCEKLGETEHDWVVTITQTYAERGAPEFTDQPALDQFLDELDELETGLDSPDETLTETDKLALLDMIAGLRRDLGGA